jgi:hypothetical protein
MLVIIVIDHQISNDDWTLLKTWVEVTPRPEKNNEAVLRRTACHFKPVASSWMGVEP